MHLRTTWRSRAANNGRKCIRLEHLHPSIFDIFQAKNSHHGLGPPSPLSKRQIASRQAIPAWNGMSVDHQLRRAEGIGRTAADPRPLITGMASPWFRGGGRRATTRRKKGMLHSYCYDSHIGYYSAWRATRALYSSYNTINEIHWFFCTVIYELLYILSRDDYSNNQLLPQSTTPATAISFDPRQLGSSSLKDEEPNINFVGGGIYAVAKLGRKSLVKTWLCNR